MSIDIRVGDCLDVLKMLDAQSVQCVVTSPPYWGLRDYGVVGQLGLERTPDEYVAKLVAVFSEVRRVMRDDATLWLNLGDSYISVGNGTQGANGQMASRSVAQVRDNKAVHGSIKRPPSVLGLAPKNLVGIPWRVAFALQADGWYLRSDIIWSKPNPMPESVTDRPTKAHEYLFLLAKSERYFYDADAIAEAVTDSTIERLSQPTLEQQRGSDRVPGKTNGPMRAVGDVYAARAFSTPQSAPRGPRSDFGQGDGGTRNRRTVWTVATQPYSGAHFATFPPALIEPCILAGSAKGDTVLDPFGGAGTTGLVADRLGRHALLIELNPAYAELARRRITDDSPLFTEVDVA